VEHALDLGEPSLEQPVLRRASRAAAIGVAAPGDIGAREVGRGLPAALVDQRL